MGLRLGLPRGGCHHVGKILLGRAQLLGDRRVASWSPHTAQIITPFSSVVSGVGTGADTDPHLRPTVQNPTKAGATILIFRAGQCLLIELSAGR